MSFSPNQAGEHCGGSKIASVTVSKTPERELTWLQRLVTLGKAPKEPEQIPATTVIDL
jgi:hypothetical protein